jgi:hypothetical protein
MIRQSDLFRRILSGFQACFSSPIFHLKPLPSPLVILSEAKDLLFARRSAAKIAADSCAQHALIAIPLAAIVCCFCAPLSWAQTSQATLQGQVTAQATGAPVAKALVIERNLQTNGQSYGYTNDQGIFFFAALQPGTYSVRVDAAGFQPEERSPVELPVASRIELNFSLQGGGAAAAAPVTQPKPAAGTNAANILSIMYGSDAAVPQALMVNLPIQATETLLGAISHLIDEREILDLPLSGRDVYTLLVLQPGVSSDNATARGLGFSVNGARVSSSNFLLDGVDNNDLTITGPSTLVSADAVKEYRMSTANFTAEYGRASGFVANAITRTGTNSFHGTVFEFFNHDRLNANTFAFNSQNELRPPFRHNQYGASLGGPLRRDRLFFFGNFEQERSSSQSVPLAVGVPTPDLVDLLPAGSVAKQLLTRFPPPAGRPIPDNPLVAINTFVIPAVQTNSLALGRADYNSVDGRQHLSARYAFSQQTTEDFFFSVYPGLNAPLSIRGQNFMANYTRELLNGTNELKFGLSRNSVGLFRPHPELPSIFSFDSVLSVNDVLLPGMESSFDYASRNTSFNLVENFSRLHGRHALGMGVEFRLGLTDSLGTQFSNGQVLFLNGTDFFLGQHPYQEIIPVDEQTGLTSPEKNYWRYYRKAEWAAFLQDNFKMTRRLTLNLGLRWEYFGVPVPRNGTQDLNFVFGPGNSPQQRVASGTLQPGELLHPDRNNFAPRAGFALDLLGDGKTVIRGGVGIFFDRVFNNIWLNLRNNTLQVQCFVQPPTVENQTGCNIPIVQAPFSLAIPASQGIPPINPAAVQYTTTAALDRNLATPYSETWFIGMQHELTPNLVVEVNQVGSLGRKLLIGDGINRPDSEARTGANPHGRSNPRFGDILYYSTQGVSRHIAIQTSLTRRWNRGAQFQISYTYARTKDEQSDPFIVPGITTPGDLSSRLAASNLGESAALEVQYTPSISYGNSDFDQRHNLVVNFVAQLPRFKRFGWLLGGWQAAGLVGVRSGFPFSVAINPPFTPGERGVSYGASFTGSSLSQAFLSKPVPVPGGLQLLDPTRFQAPPAGQLANIKRNSLFGPGFWNTDVGISRTFAVSRLGEGRQLEVRAEAFNLFNHTNLNNPDRFLNSDTFGVALFGRQGFGSALPSASPLNEQPRRIQFALKIHF